MGQIKRSIGNQCWSPEDWGTMRLKASTFKLLLNYYCCHYCFVTIQLLVRCQFEDIFLNHLFLIFFLWESETNILQHYILASPCNIYFFSILEKLCYTRRHMHSLTVCFFSDKYKQIFLNAAKPLASIPAK